MYVCVSKIVIIHDSDRYFYLNWTISDRVMAVCGFSKMVDIQSQIYSSIPAL